MTDRKPMIELMHACVEKGVAPSNGEVEEAIRETAELYGWESVGIRGHERRRYIGTFSWGVPTREAIDNVIAAAAGRPVLEVCAGRGLWAYFLDKAGVDVIAVDIKDKNSGFLDREMYFDVIEMDAATAVAAWPDRDVLMVWPHRDNTASRVLAAMEPGRTLHYVGEAEGGCTADVRFHRDFSDGFSGKRQTPHPGFSNPSDVLRPLSEFLISGVKEFTPLPIFEDGCYDIDMLLDGFPQTSYCDITLTSEHAPDGFLRLYFDHKKVDVGDRSLWEGYELEDDDLCSGIELPAETAKVIAGRISKDGTLLTAIEDSEGIVTLTRHKNGVLDGMVSKVDRATGRFADAIVDYVDGVPNTLVYTFDEKTGCFRSEGECLRKAQRSKAFEEDSDELDVTGLSW